MKNGKNVMWCVWNSKSSYYVISTLSFRRKDAIHGLVGSTHTWEQLKKFGWQVKKISVDVTPMN